LAQQIHSVFTLFLSSQPEDESSTKPSLTPALLCTSSLTPAQLAEPYSIIIGTPGHLSTLLASSKGPSTRELDVLVLDEADRLLDLGFAPTLSKIMHLLPKQRRTGLFSATMTDAEQLAELVKAGLRNPARIVVRVSAKRKLGETERVEERRIPAGFYRSLLAYEQNLIRHLQANEQLHSHANFVKSHSVVSDHPT
jgi:ATP-dependent RNA helicase DDX55/SPB4